MKIRKITFLGIWILAIILSPNAELANGAKLGKSQELLQSQLLGITHTLYLPLITQPQSPSIFGVEAYRFTPYMFDMANNAHVNWLHYNTISWQDIEPVRKSPPEYHWESVDEYALAEASTRGFNLIATVKNTPSWAQKYSGYSCGPVSIGAMPAFVEFMGALVARYSAPPYNIKYWEIGNEPDVDPYAVGWAPDINHIFGCWGDNNNLYYGGGYYATMLQNIYQPVKTVDPGAKILIGGLLLDCDYTNPPEDNACKPSRFLDGILEAGGGDYFDIVAIHAYSNWFFGSLQNDIYWPSWDKRGGIVMGKIDFVREIMAKYGVEKPVIITECGLLCPEGDPTCNPPPAEFFEAQADYVVWLYARTLAAGVTGTLWYTLNGPGWRYLGLLDGSGNPKPAYMAYKNMTEKLAGATYTRTYSEYPELKSFEFIKPGGRIRILYAQDEIPHTITLPPGTLYVFDKYGNDITPSGDQITINSPVYVELTP
jgi:hypothetical protein